MSYSSLHNHTTYSLQDGFSTPEEYLIKAMDIGLKSFAVTEHGNQYSWLYFGNLQKKYENIKILYGIECYETFDMKEKDKNNKYFHLILIAKNENGRKAINYIVTKSNTEGFYYKPRVDLNLLKYYGKDIIVLSACLGSKIAKETNYEKCIQYIKEYKSIFPYFYLEMQSHDFQDQYNYNNKILKLSQDTNTDFVITTDSHTTNKEDLYYQARMIQMARDAETIGEEYSGCYLQTSEEIHEIMDSQIGYDNVVIGLDNTNKISEICDVVFMPFQAPLLPNYDIPIGFSDINEYLLHLVYEGLETRKIKQKYPQKYQEYIERIEYEFKTVKTMGFSGYYVIVWDYVNWAKENDIIVAPGRGSAAGSILFYLIGVTEVDPLEYGLIFARFLNPERISYPDNDSDFSDKEKVVNYLRNKYGNDRVCQILNFSYITPIVAIKDVGKILNIPYHICDQISKAFVYKTFSECLQETNIQEKYPQYSELFEIANKVCGKIKTVSTHAGGVGLVNTNLYDYLGLKIGDNGEFIIQCDKKIVEKIGIVKFDLLGVSTLSILKEIINDTGIDFYEINPNNKSFINDKKTFDMINSLNTCGVFQIESVLMKDLIALIKPNNIYEVSDILALGRPDTLQFVEDYVNGKNNPNNIEYIHNDLEPILEKTYGQMIYQEQIMEIVRKIGGGSYGRADIFRKGIGSKNKELIQEESKKLYNEIVANGYSSEIAEKITSVLSVMGGYGFNFSHSLCYSVLTLQTAYLKAHYTNYFYKALLNHNLNNFGVLNKYIIEAKKLGVKLLPPNINKSQVKFSIQDGNILFGLSAIVGIGEKVLEKVLEEREKQKFKSLDDLRDRTGLTIAQLVILIKSGAIPTNNKKNMLYKLAQSTCGTRTFTPLKTTSGTLLELKTLYNIDTKDKEERLRLYNIAREKEFYEKEKIRVKTHMDDFYNKYALDEEYWEFQALSVFIENNPFEDIYNYVVPFDDVEDFNQATVVGIISNVQKKKDKNKKTFAYITIYSSFGTLEMVCWHTQFKDYEDLIKRGNKIAILCDKKEGKAYVKKMKTLEEWKKENMVMPKEYNLRKD